MRRLPTLVAALMLAVLLSGCLALLPEDAQRAADQTYPAVLQRYAQANHKTSQQIQRNPLHQILRIGSSRSHRIGPRSRAPFSLEPK